MALPVAILAQGLFGFSAGSAPLLAVGRWQDRGREALVSLRGDLRHRARRRRHRRRRRRRRREVGLSVDNFIDAYGSWGVHGHAAATLNSLFTTVDVNEEDVVTENVIYSDGLLNVLVNRFHHTDSVHPIEGAYLCLPHPQFCDGEGQVACIREFMALGDAVVSNWQSNGWSPKKLKMVPDRNAPPPKQPAPNKEDKVAFGLDLWFLHSSGASA